MPRGSIACAAALLAAFACSRASARVTDQPLSPTQVELLALAFDAASALPLDPHVKDRSRAQEAVVTASLELGQPARARQQAERIANWRSGTSHAAIASYYARHGDRDQAACCLELAARAAEVSMRDANAQEWRAERVQAAIASVRSELDKEPSTADEEKTKAIAAGLASASFDDMRIALRLATELYERHYADATRRTQIESQLATATRKLPAAVRFDLWLELARAALAHSDRNKAVAMATAAQKVLAEATWLPAHEVELRARLATIRHQAGEPGAREQVAQALAWFDAQRQRIPDVERATALRAIAQAWQAVGDAAAALSAYARAVEAGVENPNSRPRAEDLSATCLSLALHRVEPDAHLRARLHQVFQGLGDPW
jgi:hypothetical protein